MAKLTPTQIKLFEELHNSQSEDFKTFNKKSYRGVWSKLCAAIVIHYAIRFTTIFRYKLR